MVPAASHRANATVSPAPASASASKVAVRAAKAIGRAPAHEEALVGVGDGTARCRRSSTACRWRRARPARPRRRRRRAPRPRTPRPTNRAEDARVTARTRGGYKRGSRVREVARHQRRARRAVRRCEATVDEPVSSNRSKCMAADHEFDVEADAAALSRNRGRHPYTKGVPASTPSRRPRRGQATEGELRNGHQSPRNPKRVGRVLCEVL